MDGTGSGTGSPVRVFVSYAHDSAEHRDLVREFWLFLRANGVDARLDLPAAERRQDWPLWMLDQVREAAFVLVVASPAYRRRADGEAGADEGRGVQFEAALIREEVYQDRAAAWDRFLPVLLPGGSADDIPSWLGLVTSSHYRVREFTVSGAERLLRLLLGRPFETLPDVGLPPDLPPHGHTPASASGSAGLAATGLRTELVIRASVENGRLRSAVMMAGTPMCEQEVALPNGVGRAWSGLAVGALVAAERMAEAGRLLAEAIFDLATHRQVADLLLGLPPGNGVDVVLVDEGGAAALPVELLRLTTTSGEMVGPLALRAGVSVVRRLHDVAGSGAVRLPGPVKVLAAVAAPDESKTDSVPLNVEAEMQAVLDAVTDLAEHATAQVQILEVASLGQIRDALRRDAYHVLHLSAHGSPTSIELEDEDGHPVLVGAEELVGALRHAGRPVPLIVLSACSTSTGTDAIAAGLLRRGADRVLAMQAPVLDDYATALTATLYHELADRPDQPVGQALARARQLVDEERVAPARNTGTIVIPQSAIPTLYMAAADPPLVDPDATPQPLSHPVRFPSGSSVRDLGLGQLIGRRPQLRDATAILRRTPPARKTWGAASGVQLVGVGGIGKTAIAGRVVSRLRGDGWAIAIHDGRWNPQSLIATVAIALADQPRPADHPDHLDLTDLVAVLRDGAVDDVVRLGLVRQVLDSEKLLLVFDDFEQNLTTLGGTAFADPGVDDAFTQLCEAATVGAILVTCRYPLPGEDRFLVEIPVPALSPAELRRMFLRLPAIRDLPVDERRLLTRTIGGHPRLIEFVDALLRGGRADLRGVQVKLRDLARRTGIDVTRPRPLADAVNEAMLLGSADILLDALTATLTDDQIAVLHQVAVCRAPVTHADLAIALSTPSSAHGAVTEARVMVDVGGLAELTLLATTKPATMHPWTAELVTRTAATDLTDQHQAALAVHLHRFSTGHGGYLDLLDIVRHLACLQRYDEAAAVAAQGVRMLPGTLATVAFLAEVRPQFPATERAWIVVAELEINAALAAGDLPAAVALSEQTHEHIAARAAADPTNTGWQRDLSVSHERLGQLAEATGDLATAGHHYQASLDIAQRLATADPTNTDWQRDLSVSHEKVGQLAEATGDLATAGDHHQASLDIAQRLATADPTNTGWQRDLSVSHNKLGQLAEATGDLATAGHHYQADLDIAQRLATADPTNTEWQRDLSVSHSKLGQLAEATGDLATAGHHYQASLDIAQRLATADPTNTGWQRDLSVSHERLGQLAVATGDLATAGHHYQASLDIRQRLATADPTNTEWQRDLSVSHEKVGQLAVATGDLATAGHHYQASLDIAQRLATADPTNTGWQRDLSVSHNKLGQLAEATGDLATAGHHYQASLDIRQRLATADPTNTGWQRDLAFVRQRLAELQDPVDAQDPN